MTEMETLRKKAREGDRMSRIELGACYRDGKGVRRSLARAIWYYETAGFVDLADEGETDCLIVNYAGLCTESLLQCCSPAKRRLLSVARDIAAWQAEYVYYKEPDYVLGKIWRKVSHAPKAVAETLGELLWEIAMVVLPALLVAGVVVLISRIF